MASVYSCRYRLVCSKHPSKRVKLTPVVPPIEVAKLYNKIAPTYAQDIKKALTERQQERRHHTRCTNFIQQVVAFTRELARATDKSALLFSFPVPKNYMHLPVETLLKQVQVDHIRVKLQGEKGTVMMVEDMEDWESLPSDAMYVGWTVYFHWDEPPLLKDLNDNAK